jgi:molybdenum cofactor synthesis domain-containing protein
LGYNLKQDFVTRKNHPVNKGDFKMIKMPVTEAVGMVLGYDITVVDPEQGRKGVAFSRGHVITEEDIPALERLGKRNIFIWEGNETVVHEDDAALRLAPQIAGENVRFTEKPREGKVNFHATCDGIFEVDVARLEQINLLGIPSLPTIHKFFPVTKGKQVAAFRIIPLTCEEKDIEDMEKLLAEPLLSVRPYKLKRAAILVTGSEVYSGKIKDGFIPTLGHKLEALGLHVVLARLLPDDRETIRAAIEQALGECDLLFVTGGTSVDPDDVTIAAMGEAGIDFPQQGNPIQPGNNLTIGYAGETTVCAVPAAALYFEATALDIFLPQLAAGDRIAAHDIAKAGHGGLCHFCKECHYPICPFGRMG